MRRLIPFAIAPLAALSACQSVRAPAPIAPIRAAFVGSFVPSCRLMPDEDPRRMAAILRAPLTERGIDETRPSDAGLLAEDVGGGISRAVAATEASNPYAAPPRPIPIRISEPNALLRQTSLGSPIRTRRIAIQPQVIEIIDLEEIRLALRQSADPIDDPADLDPSAPRP